MSAPRDRSSLWAAAGFAVLVVVAFFPVAAGFRTFFHLDLFYEHLPVWEVTQKALAAGDSPYWIDGEYCGQPLLFHQEAPLFYPLMVPLLATGASVSRLADLFTLLHLWLAGFAAFLLLRDLTRDSGAAFFGGTAWMLSARLVQSVLWPNAVAVSALLPLMLWAILRIGAGRRRSGVLGLAVFGGLAILAARPHVLLAAAPLVAAVTAAAIARAPRRGQALRDLALGGLLALALGAPSLAPSVALYPEMSRSGGLSREERDVLPVSMGRDLAPVFLPVDGARRWPESAAYAGVVASGLFVAGFVLAARRRPFPRAIFLALAAGGLVGLVFAFGERGPYGLIAELPIISGFRVPARYLASWSLAVALGSGLALSSLVAGRRHRHALTALAIAVLAADLIWHARRAAPTAPAEVYAIRPLLVEELRRRLPPDASGFPRRYVSAADTIYPNLYSDDNLRVILRHFEPLKLALGMRFGLEAVNGYGPMLKRTYETLASGTARPLSLAGTAAVVVSGPRPAGAPPTEARPLLVEDFPGLPRAILVPEALVVPAEKAVELALSAAIDPRRTAVLEVGEPMAADPRWREDAGSVRALEYRPGRIALEARLPAPGTLVVFNAFEAGWRARVDGRPAPLTRADGAFQAVRLPQGDHRVELDYRPRGLVEGLLLGAAGVLGTLLAAMRLSSV